ncbi:TIGR02611 family protein [Mycobacterium sp. MYCO198283]|uniref:TIGR02611 family protein n=1 Tax=Mycobacterium sp. MYCO198283 TaxID=2883505 RepID=UPI001E2A2069|nr:TIGR02611 family protein [Mycobacterium sp. MYCO198283]MCG5433678.1 TIGR02611 family protein [Mycobacterium sp. MYCO198283]
MVEGSVDDVRGRLKGWRDRLRARPTANLVYRCAVGIVGTAVLVLGVALIPYPGPGWAVVFLGLGILATEFEWAQRALGWVRERYDRFMAWFHRQPAWVQITGGVLTALVVVATLWLLGALDWTAERLGIHEDWLNSPIGIGS